MLGYADCQHEIETVSAYVSDRRVLYDLLYPLESEDNCSNSMQNRNTIAAGLINDTHAATSEDTIETRSAQPKLTSNSHHSYPCAIIFPIFLSWQLEELELMDPDEAELVPEIAIDIDKTYGNQDD